MTVLELNIGQNVGSAHIHTLESDLAAVAIAFPEFSVTRAYTRTAKSGELTSCIRLYGSLGLGGKLAGRLNYLCSLTQQEAIPCILNGEPGMYGPKAEDWGPFNPDLWLVPVASNNPKPSADTLATLRAGLTIPHWTCELHKGKLTGWFERDSDGTGGGLWFAIKDGKLELRLVEEIYETDYLDEFKLFAVDVPEDRAIVKAIVALAGIEAAAEAGLAPVKINMVVKRGTNQYRGNVKGYYTGEGLEGENVPEELLQKIAAILPKIGRTDGRLWHELRERPAVRCRTDARTR